MKLPRIGYLLVILFLAQTSAYANHNWLALNNGLSDRQMRTISIFDRNSKFICAASEKNLYFSGDHGYSWKTIFSLQAKEGEINSACFGPTDQNILYAATSDGLYRTVDQGLNWQKIFSGINQIANNVRCIECNKQDNEIIYIGSEDSLRYSRDGGQSWMKAESLPHSEVKSLALHPKNPYILYLANTLGLFKTVDGSGTWKRTFVTSHELCEDEQEQEPYQENQDQSLINSISINKNDPRKIFIATGNGVYCSQDAGESWEKLPSYGLKSDFVNFVVSTSELNDALYVGTKNGVFKFIAQENRWSQLYQGMVFQEVRAIDVDTLNKEIFLASDKGIFKTDRKALLAKSEGQRLPKLIIPLSVERKDNNQNMQEGKINRNFEQVLNELNHREPSVQEVQEAALRYADVVHPEQIRDLRRSAKIKALLPEVSLDYDKTIQSGGTGNNFGNFIIGPRDWGLTLSWDVGDLVFSEQVRLIDSNTRLMVQLRDDILDEVTRLYFERRKLQTELIVNPPKTAQEKLTKILRLEELTANIDALSGGYLSRKLEK
ncbi:MAG: hypothetical protein JW869_07150 [Candidatus Omnitrophica bacterium]|nr:hypothetical protein [Candidatus Omnitrophota bacterium]